ncbi:M1 family aminopeptidase [Lutispora sp.]|uniref:M1 family aminopeptidase n=1 Tax=Lutispora sp. TaxID=2828727 RepID=UPI000EE9B800|nr:M1 family aminopeptidase [Lutispora sp.]MEA4963742.1 M1 family aminopeptidase [Lutispora sp.]HCJ57810.1 hypothetical protein [Clostridiaceae bacterium]
MKGEVKLPRIICYLLDFYVEPKDQCFSSRGMLTIKSDLDIEKKNIPLLLYYDLDVKEIRYENNVGIKFTQEIVSFPEYDEFKVNYISVHLDKPLMKNEELKLYIEYEGKLNGYTSVMQYVKDRIDKEFSIIRNDCIAYPIIAYSNDKSWMESFFNSIRYRISVNVPKEYTVGCSGILKNINNDNDRRIFTFEKSEPTKSVHRFDICISEYCLIEEKDMNLSIYAFPKHKEIAETLVKYEVKRVYDYYNRVFGPYEGNGYFTIIEIREGYGSQAGDNYILMEEHAFDNGSTDYTHLYHEIGHIWNPNVKLYYEQRSRFFDEAFASYFEVLAIKEFFGEEEAKEKMEGYRQQFVKSVNQSSKNFSVPISEYGRNEMGYNSYTKGPWVLYVLHEIVGDNKFFEIIKTFLKENRKKEVTFKDFEKICEKVSRLNLKKFFSKWLYGIESSSYLCENFSVSVMADKSI